MAAADVRSKYKNDYGLGNRWPGMVSGLFLAFITGT